MRVYLPFKDGSSVSFDGENFTVHRKPVTDDSDFENLGDLEESVHVPCKAEQEWAKNWGAVARALESAWLRQQEKKRSESAKQVYNNVKVPREDGTL